MIFLTEIKFLLFSQEIYFLFQIRYFPEAFSNFTTSFQLLLLFFIHKQKKIKVLILFLSQPHNWKVAQFHQVRKTKWKRWNPIEHLSLIYFTVAYTVHILFSFPFWRSLASWCVENSCKKNLCEVSNDLETVLYFSSLFINFLTNIFTHKFITNCTKYYVIFLLSLLMMNAVYHIVYIETKFRQVRFIIRN